MNRLGLILATGTVLGAVLAAIALSAPESRHASSPPRAAAAQRPASAVVVGANDHLRRSASELTASPAVASRVAAQFLGLFARYERGDRRAATVRTLRRLTSPSLWRLLDRATSDQPDGADVDAVVGERRGRAVTQTAARLRHRLHAQGVALIVTRRHGTWQLSGVIQ